jgi:uncharacterized protein with PhoU and TrkA domain
MLDLSIQDILYGNDNEAIVLNLNDKVDVLSVKYGTPIYNDTIIAYLNA